MIISDKHKFCFIHIPKCAGLSVRSVLQQFDDTEGRFTGYVGMHRDLGSLDYVHIPLPTLKDFFPDEYEKVRIYYSIAVVRDPFSRFLSSLAQHLKMYNHKPIQKMSSKEIMRELERSIKYLERNENIFLLPPEYIHFQKQSTYIYGENNECLIDKLYTTNQIDQLLRDLSEKVGASFAEDGKETPEHENRSVVHRSEKLRKLYEILHPVFARPLSAALSETIKLKVRNYIYVPRDTRLNKLKELKLVKDFVSSYYSEDIRIHNDVVSGRWKA